MSIPLQLADWRRQVAELYANVRCTALENPFQAWSLFRVKRDWLFAHHPQTALSEQQLHQFSGLPYFNYNPAARVIGRIDTLVRPESFTVDLTHDGRFTYTRVAQARFEWEGEAAALNVYQIEGYGGGIFLPFKDETSGKSTYGGGRYLYDTIKGADLGADEWEIVLDFNFSYNPSCAYSGRWVCPLSPEENRLPFAVQAGEKIFA